MYQLKAEAFFDSAHFLTDYFGACENLHGHRWRVEVTISSSKLNASGSEKDMVVDFSKFKSIVKGAAEELDHTFLVEEGSLSDEAIEALEAQGFSLTILPFRTTAENLAKHIADRLIGAGLPVTQVEVDETPNNRAVYIVD